MKKIFWSVFGFGFLMVIGLMSVKRDRAVTGESGPKNLNHSAILTAKSEEQQAMTFMKVDRSKYIAAERPADTDHSKKTSEKLLHYRAEGADPYQDKQTIYEKYPYLKVSDQNETRVLFNDEDWEKTYKALVDQEIINEIFAGLVAQYQGLKEENYSFVNIMRVDFIKQALRLQNNPARDLIIEKIVEVVSDFPSAEEKSRLSQKAISEMLGDKLDLIYALRMYENTRFEQLKQIANGKLRRLIDYAERNEMYHRRYSE